LVATFAAPIFFLDVHVWGAFNDLRGFRKHDVVSGGAGPAVLEEHGLYRVVVRSGVALASPTEGGSVIERGLQAPHVAYFRHKFSYPDSALVPSPSLFVEDTEKQRCWRPMATVSFGP
jgi:hypothetical protein